MISYPKISSQVQIQMALMTKYQIIIWDFLCWDLFRTPLTFVRSGSALSLCSPAQGWKSLQKSGVSMFLSWCGKNHLPPLHLLAHDGCHRSPALLCEIQKLGIGHLCLHSASADGLKTRPIKLEIYDLHLSSIYSPWQKYRLKTKEGRWKIGSYKDQAAKHVNITDGHPIKNESKCILCNLWLMKQSLSTLLSRLLHWAVLTSWEGGSVLEVLSWHWDPGRIIWLPW